MGLHRERLRESEELSYGKKGFPLRPCGRSVCRVLTQNSSRFTRISGSQCFSGTILKCKKHFIKMFKDVGMVVPKIRETRL